MLIRLCQHIVVAADATGRVTFCPDTATGVWVPEKVVVIPNETSAANGTNYADIVPKQGSTALATSRTTAATALTQNTPVNFTLTSTPEVTQAAPLHVLFDSATNGTGVALDCTVIATFRELRV